MTTLYEARQPRQCRYQSPPIAIWRLGPSGAKSPTWVAGWPVKATTDNKQNRCSATPLSSAADLEGPPAADLEGPPHCDVKTNSSAQARVKERTEQQHVATDTRDPSLRRVPLCRDSGHARAKRGHTPCDEARNSSQEHMWIESERVSQRAPSTIPAKGLCEVSVRRPCRYRTKDGLRYFKQIKGGHFEVLPAVEGGSRKSRPP